jgi:CHAT domain-containing protein
MCLGNAYAKKEMIEKAIDNYNQALEELTYDTMPLKWAITLKNLGNAYFKLSEKDGSMNLQQAINAYEQSLLVFDPITAPDYCRQVAHSLGNFYFEKNCWIKSAKYYGIAMQAAENLYKASLSFASGELELAKTGNLYLNAAYSQAKSNKFIEAIIAVEKGRAHGLRDALLRDRVDLGLIQIDHPELFSSYSDLIKCLHEYGSKGKYENLNSIQWRHVFEEERALNLKLKEVIERIQSLHGYENFLKETKWEDIIAAAAMGQPLIYFIVTSEGSLALVIYNIVCISGEKNVKIEPIWLDNLKMQYLYDLIYKIDKSDINSWFNAYNYYYDCKNDSCISEENHWIDTIERITQDLWLRVMKPVVSFLLAKGFAEAILIPTGLLALLPLHAAWCEKGDRKCYALDYIAFSYAPSAVSLIYARKIAEETIIEHFLAIDEPKPVDIGDLPNSKEEVASIASFFKNSEILDHERATWCTVMKSLPKSQVVHFSCHGDIDWNEPTKSGLVMAYNVLITIEDLIKLHFKAARLATLSACDTGIIGTELPDEVISLPSAFMRAGFAGVIAPLWQVSDKCTAMLMSNFYQLWQEKGLSPIQALRKAQIQFREYDIETGFKHIPDWAAFYLNGI